MEELGNLDDHELDQLSWKLNPQEFDRIAMQYLRVKRVRKKVILPQSCLVVKKIIS